MEIFSNLASILNEQKEAIEKLQREIEELSESTYRNTYYFDNDDDDDNDY